MKKMFDNSPITLWRKNGVENGFKSYGYGRFANGIPESYRFRTKKR
ncbi:MAG: hypothetical protein ACRC7F_03205 [Cetobacterium sp.]